MENVSAQNETVPPEEKNKKFLNRFQVQKDRLLWGSSINYVTKMGGGGGGVCVTLGYNG